MNLLSVNNLTHSFEYQLFSNLSLSLNEGQSIAIIGISGSGKSTILHILSTLLQPDEGDVMLFGKSVSSMSKKELMQIRREKLGIVFQSHYLFKGFSAYENLEVSQILSQKNIDHNLIERLQISDSMQQKVTNLSGGQQQRVSIARVLVKQPKIIFADEPTGNLDKKTATEVMDIFFNYCKIQKAGMLLVTHDEKLAYMCDDVYRLENRELIKVK